MTVITQRNEDNIQFFHNIIRIDNSRLMYSNSEVHYLHYMNTNFIIIL